MKTQVRYVTGGGNLFSLRKWWQELGLYFSTSEEIAFMLVTGFL
ncbi:hypothetical protein RQN30_12245 [Arcanobacterium hippocoleae]